MKYFLSYAVEVRWSANTMADSSWFLSLTPARLRHRLYPMDPAQVCRTRVAERAFRSGGRRSEGTSRFI
jgi:hypothetical protein